MSDRPSTRPRALALGAALLLASCKMPVPQPLPPADTRPVNQDDADLLTTRPDARAVIVPGTAPPPGVPTVAPDPTQPGDITLNFPAADVKVVAKAVLGDMLHLRYSVDPAVTGTMTLVTPAPVSRTSVLGLFERALRAADLALVSQGAGFQIVPVANASGTVAPGTPGFGSEVIQLQFVNADELKRLLDSLLPNTVTGTDPTRNAITIAGTTGQRAAVRDIVRQFDVNWLRSMSFALLVPQRTDARLIAPELDKLINDQAAPTRGLVRLITMEKLNGILAISAQPQYLQDVRRWVDILDREGESNERQLFVYQVQNGRARDLAKTLNTAFGYAQGGAGTPDTLGGDSFEPRQPPPSNSAFAPTPPPAQNGGGAAGTTPATSANSPSGGSAPSATGGAAAGNGRITISADETNNAIIVFGTPREYAVVEAALRKLDVLPFQVLIEAAITEVSLTDKLRFGVQWNFLSGESSFTLGEGATAAAPIVQTYPGFSFFTSGNDITATLNALEQRTNVKVISAPKLLVLNNQTAALQVGDQVPITTQSASAVTTDNPAIVNSVEYRDTGVILKVTPRVNASGLVLLDISQEVSNVATNQSSGIDSPVISTRRIATSIATQDGQVIALGGLFSDSRSFGKNGLPILSRIPIVGGLLFGNNNDSQTRTELLVILKAHVLRSVDDGRAITEELRAKVRTLEPFRTYGRIP